MKNYYNEKGELNGDCTEFIKDVVKYGKEKAKINHILCPACSQSLLQKWLREKHNIHVVVDITIDSKWYFELYDLNAKRNDEIYIDKSPLYHSTYEQALEKALQEALKLINNKQINGI